MNSDFIYEQLIRPLLFLQDPERMHEFTHKLLVERPGVLNLFGLNEGKYQGPNQTLDLNANPLQTSLFGHLLKNPIGLAAGFDKNGSLLPVLPAFGFGFAEIGSVCAKPHAGNPRPRLFRLPDDKALINRLGLNGQGVDCVVERLKNVSTSIPIGINIAKTNDPNITGDKAVEDLCETFSKIQDLGLCYVTINASCPNTKEGCVKEVDHLQVLFKELKARNRRQFPLLLKLSPDSADSFLEGAIAEAVDAGLQGFVCGNTTTSRNNLLTKPERIANIGQGGLSGAPLKLKNLDLLKRVKNLKAPEQILIGVGGVFTGADAFEYLSAGASAVQLYSAMVYRGPKTIRFICRELEPLITSSSR